MSVRLVSMQRQRQWLPLLLLFLFWFLLLAAVKISFESDEKLAKQFAVAVVFVAVVVVD